MAVMERSEFDYQMSRFKGFKKNPDPDRLDAYWEEIRFWDPADLKFCVTKCLQEEKTFPTLPRLKSKRPKKRTAKVAGDAEDLPAMISCRCGNCDVPFSVGRDTLLNDDAHVSCAGTGISNCGRNWKGSEICSKWYEARDRSEDVVVLW